MNQLANLSKSKERVFSFDNSGQYPLMKVRAMRNGRTQIERDMFSEVKRLFPEHHWRTYYPIMNIGIITHICCLDLRYMIHINDTGNMADSIHAAALNECDWYVYCLKWDELKNPEALVKFSKSIKNRITQRKTKEVKPYKNRKSIIRLENFGVHLQDSSKVPGFELITLPEQWTERIQIEKLGHKEAIEYMDWCVQNVMKHPYYKQYAEYGTLSKNLRISTMNFKNGTRTGKIPYGLVTGMWQHMEISIKKINMALKKGIVLQEVLQSPNQSVKPTLSAQAAHNSMV